MDGENVAESALVELDFEVGFFDVQQVAVRRDEHGDFRKGSFGENHTIVTFAFWQQPFGDEFFRENLRQSVSNGVEVERRDAPCEQITECFERQRFFSGVAFFAQDVDFEQRGGRNPKLITSFEKLLMKFEDARMVIGDVKRHVSVESQLFFYCRRHRQ